MSEKQFSKEARDLVRAEHPFVFVVKYADEAKQAENEKLKLELLTAAEEKLNAPGV